MKYKKENGIITLETRTPFFLGMVVWLCIMGAPMVLLFVGQVLQPMYDVTDIFGIGFLLVWLGVVGWMGKRSIRSAGQILTISAEGVSIKYRFSVSKPLFLSWSEIADYGYVFLGSFEYGNKSSDDYILYFAKNTLPINKRLNRKKAEKGEIRFGFSEDGARTITDYVLPFCEQYAQCQRYGAEIKE